MIKNTWDAAGFSDEFHVIIAVAPPGKLGTTEERSFVLYQVKEDGWALEEQQKMSPSPMTAIRRFLSRVMASMMMARRILDEMEAAEVGDR